MTLSEEPAASNSAVPGVIYQGPRFRSKDVAPSNMEFMPVTRETSQPEMSWLKEAASSNMKLI